MRVVFDDDGYLKEWIMDDNSGYIPNEKEQIIPTPEDIDISAFFNESHLYHLVDGKLVKDKNRQAKLDEEKSKKKRELSLQEKIELFIEAFEVDEAPERKNGVKHKPFFDKERNRFSWKVER